MISDIMNTNNIILKTKDSIKTVMGLMSEKDVNRALVVNDENKLIGMIVKSDIYRFLMEEGHYDTCPVEWVMSKNLVTAFETEEVMAVAKRILEKDIIAVPVINEQLGVEGMVSIEDILKNLIERLQ